MRRGSVTRLASLAALGALGAPSTPLAAAGTAEKASFALVVEAPEHGRVSVAPVPPKDGRIPAGTRLTVTATPDEGYALDSGFYVVPGRFGRMYHESPTAVFEVVLDRDKAIGASFVEESALEGFHVLQDVVYAKPGRKTLKYDVYQPDGARGLPIVVIVHGGGWGANDENIMRGLARCLARTGDYVVASIDYRWLGKGDGDEVPNTMADLIEDVYGAIAHVQEHATEYGGDPSRIAVTGDSAGGHLSAAAADMTDMIGDGGFGAEPGVYQYRPTYVPEGKTLAQVRAALSQAIRAAAPSYGVFSVEALAGANERLGGPPLSADAVRAIAPIAHVPAASRRSVPQFLLRGSEDPLIRFEEVDAYASALKAAGQRAVHLEVEGASHAFLDWKPDAETRATFARYGVPHAGEMKAFFDSVFYPD